MAMNQNEIQPRNSEDVIDLRNIFLLLRRQLKLIFLCTTLTLGLALIYLITVTPVFTARTLILVDPAQQNLLDGDAREVGSAQRDNARVDSEVEILRSPTISLAVINDAQLILDPEFGPSVGFADRMLTAMGLSNQTAPNSEELLQNTIRNLQEATSVRRLGLTYLIAIDVTSESPERAARIANTTAETYILNQLQSKIDSSLAARDILQIQIDAARQAVAQSDRSLDIFIDDNLADLEEESGNPRISELRRELEKLSRNLLETDVTLTQARVDLEARDYQALSDRLADEAVAELVRQRNAIELQLREAADGGQASIDLQAALAAIDSDIEQTANDSIGSLRGELARFNTQETDLRQSLRRELLSSELSSDALAKIFDLQQAAAIARNQFQSLLARVSEIETQAGVQVADSRVVSPSLAPNQPSAPNKGLILTLAVTVGLGLGIGIAFLNEYYIGGIISSDQLQSLTNLTNAAIIPRITTKADAINVVADQVIHEPLSQYAESVRKLRATIDQGFRRRDSLLKNDSLRSGQKEQNKQSNVIMVCSSIPAEGKTSLALALARVYALSGSSTLLIDADLRKPAVANRVGITTEYGMLEYLQDPYNGSGKTLVASKDPLSPLKLLLGAGRSTIPTDQLLGSSAFELLLEECKKTFEIVIIDTAPLLPVVDSRYIAPHSDAIVMVVRWATTNQSDLRAALQGLSEAAAPSARIFTALSHNEQKTTGYSYGYSSYGFYGAED